MENLIQDLEAWKKSLLTGDSRYTWVAPKEIFEKFDEIITLAKSRLNATERVADIVLYTGELKAEMNFKNCGLRGKTGVLYFRPDNARVAEPLEKLSERKGFTDLGYDFVKHEIEIYDMNEKLKPNILGGKDNAEAESKARAYLEALPDVKEAE